MSIPLIPLPYAYDALEPHISAQTLRTHHDAHHKGYVDKVNSAVEGTELAGRPLEDIVRAAQAAGDQGLFDNAGQAWNHGFYWHSLSPRPTDPGESLARAIARDFGSLEALLRALSKEAIGHFASGWAWLVATGEKLTVTSTHDAGTALTEAAIPLLTIDVWEHAYYLDVRNKRPEHVEAVVGNCLNWDFATANFASGEVWRYPQAALTGQES